MKRSNNDWFAQRIGDDDARRENFHQQKINKKAGVQQMYEKVCHYGTQF